MSLTKTETQIQKKFFIAYCKTCWVF